MLCQIAVGVVSSDPPGRPARRSQLRFFGDVAKAFDTTTDDSGPTGRAASAVRRAAGLALRRAASRMGRAADPLGRNLCVRPVLRSRRGAQACARSGDYPYMQGTSHSLSDQCSSREDELGRARADADRARELVATHGKVHELIAAGAPLEDVLVELIKGVECQDRACSVAWCCWTEESSTLHPGAGPSLPAHWLEAIDGVVIGPDVGRCGAAAWSGELTISSDIATDPNWAPMPETSPSTRVFVTAGRCRSSLRRTRCWAPSRCTSETRAPTAEHLTLMKDGARVAGIAIERGRTLDRLMHDARHDGLTGLPNRTRIFDALDKAIVRSRPGSKVAAMFVDVDGLKHLNDTLGHDQADGVVRQDGERLSLHDPRRGLRGPLRRRRVHRDRGSDARRGAGGGPWPSPAGCDLAPPARYRFSVRHREHRDNAAGRRRSGCARGAAPGRQRHV